MSTFSITVNDGNYDLSGVTGQRTQRAAERHLPLLRDRARRGANATGADIADYRIAVDEHETDCTGMCADELGLAPGCRSVTEYRIDN